MFEQTKIAIKAHFVNEQIAVNNFKVAVNKIDGIYQPAEEARQIQAFKVSMNDKMNETGNSGVDVASKEILEVRNKVISIITAPPSETVFNDFKAIHEHGAPISTTAVQAYLDKYKMNYTDYCIILKALKETQSYDSVVVPDGEWVFKLLNTLKDHVTWFFLKGYRGESERYNQTVIDNEMLYIDKIASYIEPFLAGEYQPRYEA